MQMVVKTTNTPVDGDATTTTETLNFSYDASGVPLALDYNGTDYYYVTNIQGDIMAILNTSGEPVVQYNYDAWGKLHSFFGSMEDTLGEVNPLTYRGYVYDRDSGYYYLQSRYYAPDVGRFINADELTSTGQGFLGNNMFTYCLNNPISCLDASGKFALSAFVGAVVGGALGGAIISTVSHVVNCAINGQEMTASGLANAAITGAVAGAIGGAIGTVNLAAAATTIVVKGVASAAVGIGIGIKVGLETEGSSGKRWATGIATGLITAGSTFYGSRIEAYDAASGFAGNVFTNAATTLFVGVPAEIASVGAQQLINTVDRASHSLSASRPKAPSRDFTMARALVY